MISYRHLPNDLVTTHLFSQVFRIKPLLLTLYNFKFAQNCNMISCLISENIYSPPIAMTVWFFLFNLLMYPNIILGFLIQIMLAFME